MNIKHNKLQKDFKNMEETLEPIEGGGGAHSGQC
jgi:hypothetical protein